MKQENTYFTGTNNKKEYTNHSSNLGIPDRKSILHWNKKNIYQEKRHFHSCKKTMVFHYLLLEEYYLPTEPTSYFEFYQEIIYSSISSIPSRKTK